MGLPEADTALFLFINRDLQNTFFDRVMPFVTSHTFLVFFPFVLLLAMNEKKRIVPALIAGLFAIAVADSCSSVLKEVIMRQRPFNLLDNVHLLVGRGKSYSMPSNHAANAFAFAVTLRLVLKSSLGPLLIAAAGLIAFSRISVGVHYPSDVLAGALLGTCIAYASLYLYRWAERIFERKSYDHALFFLLMLISFFRISYIITGPFDLSPDEVYSWEWSRRPDGSYAPEGPITGWIIGAGALFFGATEIGIRFFAVVLSACSSILLFRLGRELYNERTGFASGVLMQIVPIFSVFGMLLTADAPLVFFWILSLYLFHGIVRQDQNAPLRSWVLLGVSVGAGLLTRQTMAFFLVSASFYLIFQRDARRLLTTPGPYLALGISMLLSALVLSRNASYDWVLLKHAAGQLHLQEGPAVSARTFAEFAVSQFGVITPLLFVMSFFAMGRLKRSREGSLLFWFSLPVIGPFLLISLRGDLQANEALTGYITALIAFSFIYISRWEHLGRLARIGTASSVFLALSVTLVAHFPSVIRLPDRLDPSLRLMGWRELGKETDARYREMLEKGPASVFSDSCEVAAELAFYMDGNPATFCEPFNRKMTPYGLRSGFAHLKNQHVLFVRTDEKDLPGEVGSAFSSCGQEVITVKTKRKKTMKFTLLTCYDFKGFEYRPLERLQ